MEGSHGKHSLEKRLSDAARRRQQHLETIRAKQQKMTKSPTASKDSKKGNSRADDEQSTSASSTPNNRYVTGARSFVVCNVLEAPGLTLTWVGWFCF